MCAPSLVEPIPDQYRYHQFQRDRCDPRRPFIGQHKRRPIIALFRHGQPTRSWNGWSQLSGKLVNLRPPAANVNARNPPRESVFAFGQSRRVDRAKRAPPVLTGPNATRRLPRTFPARRSSIPDRNRHLPRILGFERLSDGVGPRSATTHVAPQRNDHPRGV
jgi:hypothetical protein